MKRYVYVEARDVAGDGDPGPLVSFASVTLLAENGDSAYRLGPVCLRDAMSVTGGDPWSHFDGKFLNDYVADISME